MMVGGDCFLIIHVFSHMWELAFLGLSALFLIVKSPCSESKLLFLGNKHGIFSCANHRWVPVENTRERVLSRSLKSWKHWFAAI